MPPAFWASPAFLPILYVLADTIERETPRPGARGLMVTIGPGVTVGMMLLGW